MELRWTLRELLKERGMTRVSQISKIILERTGYILSIQAVCDLLNGRPKMLKVKTLQAICDAFYCKLSDFCEVMPLAASKAHATMTRSCGAVGSSDGRRTGSRQQPGNKYHNASVDFAALFPNARKFSSELTVRG